ncbi:MAG: hypothetical protein K2O06_11025 [Acetatifactor sp.]|nr:hypothetical protein [Acetatifactor sp.]
MLVVIADPFYQYHKPWLGMPVMLENAVYQTPGAARNLDYTDVIVGTSMTENFHTSWFDEEMGWNTMKLSYSGARTDDLKAIFSQIFSREEPVHHIFMDINTYQLTSPSWTAYVERPEYLYDRNIFNDFPYLFNWDVLADSWGRILDGIMGKADNIDTAYTWEDPELFGAQKARKQALEERFGHAGEVSATMDSAEALADMLDVCQDNLDNILPFIRENPDTEFIIYLPPYSMLFWEHKVVSGDLENVFQMYYYAMQKMLEYPNVTLYDFQNEKEIITRLDNYMDSAHHRPEYNRYIFECIKNGEKRVTKENMEEKIRDMYEFAQSYDYAGMWGE